MIGSGQRQAAYSLRSIVLVSVAFFLCSCGGGSGGGGTPPPTDGTGTGTGTGSGTGTGTGSGSGTGIDISGSGIGNGDVIDISGSGIIRSGIDGFGSIIINGREYDTNSASFSDDGNELAIQADFNIGKFITLEVNFDELTAEHADYRSSLKAPIASIVIVNLVAGEASIVALNQTIITNASTNFENVQLNLLIPGDLIEVSGVRDEVGNIVASFVERKPVLANYKLTGEITNVTADSFSIGLLIVNYSTASLKDFPNGIPEEGQSVEVKAAPTDYLPPDNLSASTIEFFSSTIGVVGGSVELEGFITSFTSVTDFEISGFSVTTLGAETTYFNGTEASLALGAKLEVNGSLNADGILEVNVVVIKPTDAVEVKGNVDSVDLEVSTISSLGLTFEIRSSTQLEDKSDADLDNMTLADFSPGDRIELRGHIDGTGLVATKIEREDPDDDVSFQGLVNQEDESAGTLEILGVLITPDINITEFENEDGGIVSQAEFHTLIAPGSFVEAKWDVFTSLQLAPDSLEIE